MRNFLLSLAVAAATLPVSGQIIKRPDPKSDLDRLAFQKKELRVTQTLTDADALKGLLPNRDAIAAFRSQYGERWRFTFDQRTGRVNLLQGGAIPFIPGPANRLAANETECRTVNCTSREKIVALAKEFLAKNRAVIQVNPEELVADPVGTTPIGNSVYFIRLQWMPGGVPVEGGSVFMAVNNGNLIQVGSQDIANLTVDPKPSIPVAKAWDVVKKYVGGLRDNDVIVNQGTLSILPVTPAGLEPDTSRVPFGKGLGYVLVWKVAFTRPGVIGTWEGTVDAHTGELLRFRDINEYGHVQGGVYKTDVPQTEVTMAFPKADYGATVYADESGNFTGISGTSTLSGLNAGSAGVAGGVRILDNCGAISLNANGVGYIDFGTSAGTDCTTPGSGGAGNTHSARTQYWNVTQIKMKGSTYLPANTWLQQRLDDNVNINSVCNAYWNGSSVNFFKSGSGCGNTGELPGVSLHEWGHGMDTNDGSGVGIDNFPVEARADWTALLQTHQSCTGSGFRPGINCSGYGDACNACTGVRDADWAQHASNTPWTPQNKGTVWGSGCGGGSGPCGWEDHCESGVATQALWDFVNRDLVGPPTNLDPVTAWQLEDRLFYTGMPQSTNMYTCTVGGTTTSNGCGAGSLYTVMRAIDDDGDGVGNGTPHAAAIFAALNRHGIACGAAGDPANQNQTSCPALVTPTVTATASNASVTLNWTSGGVNATRYFVYRNETSCGAGFTKIATVSAPTLTYTDATVVHGVTYYYRVQAATANDSCVSAMSACVTIAAQLAADRDFYVRDWTNSVSVHDNGEQPSTNYLTNWAWTSDVWNRGTNSPGSPNSSDWYPTDNLYVGAGTFGDNYGFARVHRNATGSAAAVTAEFLISPFGAGSNFSSVGSTVINFAASDAVLTQGAYYHQNATSSTHACIAVQISTADDPYQSPNLAGHSPGDPDGQSLLLVDNNKAQRNLGVSLNVAHFSGFHYGLIHNPALQTVHVVLHLDTPDPQPLEGAQVQVVGGETVPFGRGAKIEIGAMKPGENRWIAVKAAPDREVPLHVYDVTNERVVNAFTFDLRPVPVPVAIRENLRNHMQVFNRFAAAFGVREAGAEAESVRKLLDRKEVTPAQYLAFLRQRAKAIRGVVAPLVDKNGRDDFGIVESLRSLDASIARKAADAAAAEHGALLERLDSLATMMQKEAGDPDDILQMVRWQSMLYRTRRPLADGCGPAMVKLTDRFIESWPKSREEYTEMMRGSRDCFARTAEALQSENLKNAAAALDHGMTEAALEKAQRQFLLILDDATAAK